MLRRLMKSKVHRATITSADLHYEGSLTLDEDLMDAADLLEHEEIQVVNVNNGARFSTYVIPGARGSGTVQLNGAAARLGMPGDLVILISYGDYDQRVEAFGNAGMAVSDNPRAHAGWSIGRDGTTAQPLPWFFLDRYLESYRQEWRAFHIYLVEGGPSPVGTADARACTAVALAAGLSLREGRPVQVKEVG